MELNSGLSVTKKGPNGRHQIDLVAVSWLSSSADFAKR